MNILFKNIKGLVQAWDHPPALLSGHHMGHLPVVEDAWLLVRQGVIEDFGPMKSCPKVIAKQIDARDRFVFPSFIDSHTHMVFARSREVEFEKRIEGKTQEEIEAEGLGICRSAELLRDTSEEELYQKAQVRLERIIATGTGAVEIKSGYGLGLESELKMLRVIRRLHQKSLIPIRATFMGAHAIPVSYRAYREDYIRLLVEDMLPKIAREGLADYIDAFCDRGFFTPEETDRILKAGEAYGLRPKIHTNELCHSGGVSIGKARHALSMDGLVHVRQQELRSLRESGAIATVLPGPSFFANLPFPDARRLIDEDLPVALASDYNPGTSPSGNLCFIFSLACIKLGMTVAEAVHALTVNAAAAIGLEEVMGSISRGKKANIFMTVPMPSMAYLPYSFANNLIEKVVLEGRVYPPEREQVQGHPTTHGSKGKTKAKTH
jgi:imidazolonepropionase